jgi:glycosyltransferase
MKTESNNILISVIVPVYNAERFLSKCIESILDQTFKDFELLLINDGSKDKSLDICNEYFEKFPNKIKIFNNKNMGCSATRNFGIEHSQGNYLLFIDSDDWIEKDMLEKMYQKTLQEDSDVVISGIFREDNILNVVSKQTPKYTNNPYFWFDTDALVEFACNKLHKKSIIIENDLTFPINSHAGEDMVFNVFSLINSKKISVVPNELYHYIIHGDNSIYNLEKRVGIFISLDIIYNYLKKRNFIEVDEIFKRFKTLSKIHLKTSFRKLLYAKNRKEFNKYMKIFLENTSKIEYLNFKDKLKIYNRAFMVYIIYHSNLKKIIEWREKILVKSNNKNK